MGRYLTPGHTYNDGDTITGPSLTEHVSEATFKPTAITEQTLKTPAALTDQLLVVSSGSFFQETLQQIHDLILYPGCVVQTVYAEYTANTNLTTVIPADDTIPQNTEGTEIISLSITPRFSSSTVLLRFEAQFETSTLNTASAAIFRDSTANAIASGAERSDTNPTNRGHFHVVYMDSPATTSSVSYKVRVGPGVGTMRINGTTTARVHGGVLRSTIVAQEIKQ